MLSSLEAASTRSSCTPRPTGTRCTTSIRPCGDRFAAFLDRHRLRHVFRPGENPQAFSDQLAATDFPPPVGTLMGLSPQELYAMKKELDSLRERSIGAQLGSLKRRVRGRAAKVR